MKPNRREFIKSVCLLTGGAFLLGSKVHAFEKNKNIEFKKEEKQCASIYCKYNDKGICLNRNISNR